MPKTLKRVLLILGAVLIVLLLGVAVFYTINTVTSRKDFYQYWHRTAGKPVSADDWMTGSWTGAWKSLGFKDSGHIRCIITLTNNTAYHARFLSGHYAVFESEDTVLMAPVRLKDRWEFKGSTDLGAEGTYHYDGTTDGAKLHLKWNSATDHGELTLMRE